MLTEYREQSAPPAFALRGARRADPLTIIAFIAHPELWLSLGDAA